MEQNIKTLSNDKLKNMLKAKIQEMAVNSDLVVHTLYGFASIDNDNNEYLIYEKKQFKDSIINIDINFIYDGVGVWYLINQTDNQLFKAVKVLIAIKNDAFIHHEIGEFSGKWQYIPEYISNDKMVQKTLLNIEANDI